MGPPRHVFSLLRRGSPLVRDNLPRLDRFLYQSRCSCGVLRLDSEALTNRGIRQEITADIFQTCVQVTRTDSIFAVHLRERPWPEEHHPRCIPRGLETRSRELMELRLKHDLVNPTASFLTDSEATLENL